MRDRLRMFMMGRYGHDQLNRFLSIVAIVIIVLHMFIRNRILWTLGLLVLAFIYYRCLSKNHQKRYRENLFYLEKKDAVMSLFTNRSYQRQRNAGFRIYKCPTCRQKIRIPKGKGRIQISCPKCKTQFIKKS